MPATGAATSGNVPETWNSGAARRVDGCGAGSSEGGGALPISSATSRPIAPCSAATIGECTNARCDSVAPFGRPVVPLVNRMMAGSSSPMATSGGSGSSLRAGPSNGSSSARSCRASPSGSPTSRRRSSRRSSANTTVGADTSMPCESSDAVHQPLRLDTMAPSETVAHQPIT